MKIVILINSMAGGGAERVTSTLADYLDRNAHHITIVCLHHVDCSYALPSGVNLHYLRSGKYAIGLVKILLLPLFAWEFARLLDRINPDAVLSLLTRSNFVHALTRWWGNKRPILVSERCDLASFSHKGRGWMSAMAMKKMIYWLYHDARLIIAISNGVSDSLVQLGVRTPIRVIYNPQPIERIRQLAAHSRPMPLSTRRYNLVTCGRLEHQKNHHGMIEALALVARQCDVHLTILGKGPLLRSLEEHSKALGVADRITFAGWVANPFSVMRQADLFVLGSSAEGFGNVIVEAMACGLPVVSTDCPSGPREILADGAFGELVPAGDTGRLADTIISLLKDEGRRSDLGRLSQERAKDFDVDVICQQYVAVLNIPPGS